MKRSVFVPFLSISILLSFSCTKSHYYLRFRNNYKEVMEDVAAGSAVFGEVLVGQTTSYLTLTTHSFLISGTAATSGLGLSKTEAVSGSGTHKWTITLDAQGNISLTKDE